MTRVKQFFFALIFLLGAQGPYAYADDVEIPRLILTLNDIVDLPVDGFQRFVTTTQGIIEVENLPGNLLRLQANSSGTTFLFVWDAQGRKTYQVEVTGFAPNIISDFRPGYNPDGSEFIYRSSMNQQFASGQSLYPFWNHDFSSSVPVGEQGEWRSIVSATTNNNGLNNDFGYAPFSQSTYPNQMLSYYRNDQSTFALGDVNYNPGQLSLIGYPLRGGLVEFRDPNSKDQVQFFGGLARPRNRLSYVFQDPSESIFGYPATKEMWKNVSLSTSFVHVDAPENFSLFGQNHQDDYVMDVSLVARPLSGLFSVEAEYAKSRDDRAIRGLVEFSPFWGRVMLIYQEIGENYISPSSFFMLRNFRQGTLITDVQATRNLGFNLNYQVSEFGSNDTLAQDTTLAHRATVSSFYRASDQVSYIVGSNVVFSDSDTNQQRFQRLFATYQWFDPKTRDQRYIQLFLQNTGNEYSAQSFDRKGVGADARIVKNYSKIFNVSYFQKLQFNRVNNNTNVQNHSFLETFYTLGSIVNYIPNRVVYSAGFSNNVVFQNFFGSTTNLFQPFASVYFNPNQALTLGARVSYNFDPTQNYHFASLFGELVYRFGSRVRDTLKAALMSKGQVKGLVFIDSNGDGQYQDGETVVQDYQLLVNQESQSIDAAGRFSLKVPGGKNQVQVVLPAQYEGYTFTTENPKTISVYPGTSQTLHMGLQKRLPMHGRVDVQGMASDEILQDVKVQIQGQGIQKVITVSPSGVYNAFVYQEGTYQVRLMVEDLPVGYIVQGETQYTAEITDQDVFSIEPFVVAIQRRVLGRAFIDENKNARFDFGTDQPLPGITITLGKTSVETQSDGTFLIDGLSPGVYTVEVHPASKNNKSLYLRRSTIEVPAVGQVELTLPYQ